MELKKTLLNQLLEELSNKIERNNAVIQGSPALDEDTRKELAGPEEIEFETMKVSHSIESNKTTSGEIFTIKQLLENLRPAATVGVGALVTVKNGTVRKYLIVPVCGGIKLSVHNEPVVTIAKNAPIVERLDRKKKGDIVIYNGYEIEVLDVQ